MALSGLGIVVAAVFLWRLEFDRAFIAAVLGMVAWFLNYRVQMTEITAAADKVNQPNNGDDQEDENEFRKT